MNINKKDIKEIKLYQNESPDGKTVHLVIMKDGTEHNPDTKVMKKLNLIKMRGTKHNDW